MLDDALFSVLTKNTVRCNHCLDQIESVDPMVIVSCKCGASAISGGLGYRRYHGSVKSFTPLHEYRRLTEDELVRLIHVETRDRRNGRLSIGFHDLMIREAEKRLILWYNRGIEDV